MLKIRLKTCQFARVLAQSPLSQSAWARRLGVSRSYISQLATGQKCYPSAVVRKRILTVLNAPFGDLFESEEAENVAREGSRETVLELNVRGFSIQVRRGRESLDRERGATF